MDNIKIEKVRLTDIEALQEIGRQTFSETFSDANTEENMLAYLEEGFSLGKLEAELSQASSQFYFAVLNGEVIGYLKLNTGHAQTELQDQASLEIERIYVKSAFHGKKAGQLLYEKALEVALLQKKAHLWLGVWEENPKAIRFYEKNGFVAFDKHIFKFGEDEQTDIMMKKILR